jgi:Mg/Co/Ni transporter MgtE
MEMKTDKLKTKEIVFCAFKNPVIPIPVPQPQTNNTQLNGNKILNSLDDQKAIMKYQNLLIESSDEEIKLIVNDLKGKYRELILDKNGNFFCKDLFKTCDRNERIEILKELSPTLSVDCRDNYATHPLQALIEYSG